MSSAGYIEHWFKKHEGLQNESLYGVWSTHCILANVQARDLLANRHTGRCVFGKLLYPDQHLEDIATGMGIPVQEIKRLRGFDISAGLDDRSPLLRAQLRFCPECLDMGYHSVLFQHVAIARCPLHGKALQDCCPACANPIVPTFESAAEHPYECPHCDHPLARTVAGEHDLQHALWVDQMLGARRGVLARSVDVPHQVARFKNLPEQLCSASDPRACRHYQRACVWAPVQDTQWTRFHEIAVSTRARHDRGLPLPERNLNVAARNTLIWLQQECSLHENAALRLAARLGRYPRGLRLNAHASVIAVALYKLASVYDLLPDMHIIKLADMRAPQASCDHYDRLKGAERFGDAFPLSGLDSMLYQYEILGMFAKLLVRQRTDSYLENVDWLDLPHAIEFAPSFFVDDQFDPPVVRIRTRATWDSVRRLLRRRWMDQLHYCRRDPVGHDGMWHDNILDSVWSEGDTRLVSHSYGRTPAYEAQRFPEISALSESSRR